MRAADVAIAGSGARTTGVGFCKTVPFCVFGESNTADGCGNDERDGGAAVDPTDPMAGLGEPRPTNLMAPVAPAARSAAATNNQVTIPPLRAEGLPLDWVFEIGGAVRSGLDAGASEVAA